MPPPLFNEEEVKKYRVYFENGRLLDANKEPLSGCGKFVQKKDGCIYSRMLAPGEDLGGLKHAQLGEDKGVLMAGYLMIKNGVLDCFNHHTGHYLTPVILYSDRFKKYLKGRGITLDSKKSCQSSIKECSGHYLKKSSSY